MFYFNTKFNIFPGIIYPRRKIGINGMALDWIILFVTNRTFADKTSIYHIKIINTGVPQG